MQPANRTLNDKLFNKPRSAFTNWKKHWFQYGAEIPSHYFGFVLDMEKDLTVARLENGKFRMLTEQEIQEQLEERS